MSFLSEVVSFKDMKLELLKPFSPEVYLGWKEGRKEEERKEGRKKASQTTERSRAHRKREERKISPIV